VKERRGNGLKKAIQIRNNYEIEGIIISIGIE
jgi:hypothetical protein